LLKKPSFSSPEWIIEAEVESDEGVIADIAGPVYLNMAMIMVVGSKIGRIIIKYVMVYIGKRGGDFGG
jgi:hypothetical protein